MPEGTSVSLVNLDGLAKPADTFIKKVSEAVGGVFAPFQVVRMAKAKKEAALIRAQGEVQITDLHRRAMHRFVEEEAQRQQNIEDITAKALPHLNESANPEAMERDWITNFFDKSRIITDQDMQALWARALAGEANLPGTFSKRTVNFLADLDKADAKMFSKLCGFVWKIEDTVPLIFNFKVEIYNKQGIKFSSLSHLESIGLIQFDGISSFSLVDLPDQISAHYFDRPLQLNLVAKPDNNLRVGNVMLTKTGQELAPICGSKPVDGFWEYVLEQWRAYLPTPLPSSPAKATG